MTVWMDGGLATHLQSRGLPAYTPVTAWLMERPAEVTAAHRAFVEAGAQVILAGTFSLHPALHRDALALIPRAVALAAAARPPDLYTCHGSPRRAGEAPWQRLPEARKASLLEGWAQVAAVVRAQPARGLVLETFTDPVELAATVKAVREGGYTGDVVASLTPRDDGRLWSGAAPEPHLRALRDAGADVVGFNCGRGPEAVWAACVQAPSAMWARPAASTQPEDDAASIGITNTLARLADRVAWVGGCCGVSPSHLAAARRAWYRDDSLPPDPRA